MPIRVFGKSVERAGGELSMTTATTSEPGSALQVARHGAQPGMSRRKRRSGSHPTGQANEVLTQVSMLVGRGAEDQSGDLGKSGGQYSNPDESQKGACSAIVRLRTQRCGQ
ncbi:hypothetical protein [Streptomyces sp. NBC_01238]|uniref:hypothetical protein n=1 Tax=Streptomyces sp. NBC_01238 TaxID=2903791 RepID=UPI00386ADA13